MKLAHHAEVNFKTREDVVAKATEEIKEPVHIEPTRLMNPDNQFEMVIWEGSIASTGVQLSTGSRTRHAPSHW